MGADVLSLLAHADAAPAPHDLAGAWHADPVVLGGLALALVLHRRGRRADDPAWRTAAFHLGLAAIATALLSPLDAASSALMSAHMLQHDLLLLVAAPLLVVARPGPRLLRGLPGPGRRTLGRTRRGLRLGHHHARILHHPVLGVLALVVALWSWHAAAPYTAALDHDFIHVAEHSSMLVAGWLFWAATAAAARAGRPATAVAMLFVAALQGVLLGMLLLFSSAAWYDAFASSTQAWGLTPLADQQLAGVLLWLPASLLYVLVAVRLVVRVLDDDPDGDRNVAPGPTSTVDPGGVRSGSVN